MASPVVITHNNAFGTGVLDIQVTGLFEETVSAGDSFTISNDVILRDNMRVGTVVLTWDGDFRLDPDEGNTVTYLGHGTFNNPITEANPGTNLRYQPNNGATFFNAAQEFTGDFILDGAATTTLANYIRLGVDGDVGTGKVIIPTGRGGGFGNEDRTVSNELILNGTLGSAWVGSTDAFNFTGEVTVGSEDGAAVFFQAGSNATMTVFHNKLTDGGFDTPITSVRGQYTFLEDNEISGNIAIQRGAFFVGDGGSTGLLGTSPEVIMGGNASVLSSLTFDRTGTYEVVHDFVDSASNPGGRITFLGGGTAVLTGDSTVSAHAASAGDNVMVVGSATTLLMEGSHTTSDNYLVQTGGTLGGSGSITASTIGLASGAFLAPGGLANPGTLDLDAVVDLTLLNQSGQLIFRLGTVSDRIDNTSASLGFIVDMLEFGDFDFMTLAGFGAGTYTLMTGTFTGTVLGGDTTGFINGFESELVFDGVDTLSLTVIPEPGTVAAILGALALGLVLWRRKRS